MKTILVVDDLPVNQQFLSVLLGYSHHVLTAGDGVEALKILEDEKADLVIADILMPTMDGYELVQRMKSNPATCSIPIVFYTATYRETEARRLADTCGVRFVISKPAEPEVILRIVQDILGAETTTSVAFLEDTASQDMGLLTDVLRKTLLETERTSIILAALVELGLNLAAIKDIPKLIETFARAIRDIIPCKYSFAGLLDENKEGYSGFAFQGVPEIVASQIGPPPPKEGLAKNLVSTLKVVRLLMPVDPWLSVLATSVGRIESILGVPIICESKGIGLFYLVNKIGGNAFAIDDERTGISMAAQLAAVYKAILQQKRSDALKQDLEKQLLQSQKMEAIGQLAGGVAHDFNNTLMAITTYLDLIIEKMPPKDPTRKYVAEIQKIAHQGARLTKQLLAFSRKQVVARKVMNLNESILDMENMLHRLLGQNVELKTILHPDLGSIEEDAGQVQQVIMNLAVNARDAMPNGGSLIIETSNEVIDEQYARKNLEAKLGQYVLLTIKDTGHGMNQETLNRIFEPFFTTKEEGKGTGLGLSTVYGIVKQSGGHILASSEEGKGTGFQIYFPRVKELSKSEIQEKKSIDIAGHGETILLVDDDDSIRTALGALLELKGFAVLQAKNGKEALEKAKNHPESIQLLITDMIMPGMSGAELARTMKSKFPSMKVLHISGHAKEPSNYDYISSIDIAFLSKPSSIQEILEKIERLLLLR